MKIQQYLPEIGNYNFFEIFEKKISDFFFIDNLGLTKNSQPPKVRVLFKGGSYYFFGAKTAGLIQGRVSFKGGSLSRIYGKQLICRLHLQNFSIKSLQIYRKSLKETRP